MTNFENSEEEVKNEVRRIIEELKSEVITVENYKKYVTKINNRNELIASFIQNNIARYKGLNNKLEKQTADENYKRAVKERFVPMEVYEIQQDMNQIFKDTYSWKALSADMSEIFFKKISDVLEDIKALDIKRDALQEIRDMEKIRNENHLASIKTIVENTTKANQNMLEMMEQVINHKLGMLDEKITSTVNFIEQESTLRSKYLVNSFIESINITKGQKGELEKNVESIDEDNVNLVTKLKKDIKKPVKGLDLKHIYKKLEDEENIDLVKKEVIDDDDPFAKKDDFGDIDEPIIVDDEE